MYVYAIVHRCYGQYLEEGHAPGKVVINLESTP